MHSAVFSPAQWGVRPLEMADIDQVLAIQAERYGPEFSEGAQVVSQRLSVAHQCSWAAVRQGTVVGYLAAYWSVPGAITPLHGAFAAYDKADWLYLHDMAIAGVMQGQGVAKRLLQAAREQARQRGVRRSALVSVQGSRAYWERHGYAVEATQEAQQLQHLASYGEDALYMVGPV